jgi:hypothetical protein
VLLFQSSVWTWGFQGGERRGGSKRSAELWSVLIIISVAWLLVCTTVSLKVFTFPPSCCVCVFFFAFPVHTSDRLLCYVKKKKKKRARIYIGVTRESSESCCCSCFLLVWFESEAILA